MLFKLIKLIIFVSFIGGTVFSFQTYDRYVKAKLENPDISLLEVIKQEGKSWLEFGKKTINLEKKAKGEIKKLALDEVARALKIYYLDNAQYPFTINELIPEYINKDANIVKDPTFHYYSSIQGYQMEVELEIGEKYIINK